MRRAAMVLGVAALSVPALTLGQTPSASPPPQPSPATPCAAPSPSPSPSSEPLIVLLDQPFELVGENSTVSVTFDHVEFRPSYGRGFAADRAGRGRLFLAIRAQVRAVEGLGYVNSDQWQAFVRDELLPTWYLRSRPELYALNLPAGRTTVGWLVWKVPATHGAIVEVVHVQTGATLTVKVP